MWCRVHSNHTVYRLLRDRQQCGGQRACGGRGGAGELDNAGVNERAEGWGGGELDNIFL